MPLLNFTIKQVAILNAINNKRADGEFCDVYDLIDSLPYIVKRDALLHSIRLLVDAGLVQRLPSVKRGGRMVRPFMVTASGAAVVS